MKSFSAIHYISIILILLSLLMKFVYFSGTGNFNSPIIDFEFVKDTSEVKQIFLEDNEFKKDVIQGVNNQNLLDYAYMIAYTALLVLVFMKISKKEHKIVYNIGIVFAAMAIIGDSIENIQLFRISELLVARLDFSKYIDILIISTRVKWLSLAFAFFILSFHYYKNKFVGKLFSMLTILPIMIAVLSVFIYSVDTEMLFSYSVILGFVVLIIWTFISVKFKDSVSFYK